MLLDRVYDLIETKVPYFLYKLAAIRYSLSNKNTLIFKEDSNTFVVVDNPDFDVCISVHKGEDWHANISLLGGDALLDITLDKKVIVTDIKPGYIEKINKKKGRKQTKVRGYLFSIYVPISSFIKYIPKIISTYRVSNVYTYLHTNFDDIIKLAIKELTNMYINSYEKLRKENPNAHMTYSSKYINNPYKYILNSDRWISEAIKIFSADQILLLSRIFSSLNAIQLDIQASADISFNTYKREHYPSEIE